MQASWPVPIALIVFALQGLYCHGQKISQFQIHCNPHLGAEGIQCMKGTEKVISSAVECPEGVTTCQQGMYVHA